MKKILSALCLLIGIAAHSQSVNGAMDNTILQQADAMGRAFIAKDYASFLKYSHPSVIRMMGGKEKMLADTTESFKAFEDEGVTFLNVTFTSPAKILESEGELQTTFTQMIEMKVPGGKVTAYARVIALSKDSGANWYFIDATEHTLEEMQRLIPSLHNDLVLPDRIESSFEEDTKSEP